MLEKMFRGKGTLEQKINYDLKVDEGWTFLILFVGLIAIFVSFFRFLWLLMILILPLLIWYNSFLLTQRDMQIYSELQELKEKTNVRRKRK